MNAFENIEEGRLVIVVYECGDYKNRQLTVVENVTKQHIIPRSGGYFSRKTGHSCGPRAADMSQCYIEEPACPNLK